MMSFPPIYADWTKLQDRPSGHENMTICNITSVPWPYAMPLEWRKKIAGLPESETLKDVIWLQIQKEEAQFFSSSVCFEADKR